ncbi:hypothetical protein [Lentzea cavernae]|uniref:Uncharacterized protein n=1 Tax=Lentzea cavernae TaxID=2020703 RepID=A0ABQ3MBS2_9PSEU|nr:hypothetical protein [Lentzea cavernae]GHH38671.1 hypothetical protein GCM10017774_28970 [Lentzea cavernae]
MKAEGGRDSRPPEDWLEGVVLDGILHTGHNPTSARALAVRLVCDTAIS